jgi:hypothetical protein
VKIFQNEFIMKSALHSIFGALRPRDAILLTEIRVLLNPVSPG